VKAVEVLTGKPDSFAVNLGVGKGYSNLEILHAVEEVTGKKISVVNKPRRWGDPDAIWADNTKAKELLGWTPQYTSIASIIETAWKWHEKHPKGY